jgi:hypothetical protein
MRGCALCKKRGLRLANRPPVLGRVRVKEPIQPAGMSLWLILVVALGLQ